MFIYWSAEQYSYSNKNDNAHFKKFPSSHLEKGHGMVICWLISEKVS